MNKSIYRTLILILLFAGSLGWETNFLEAAEKDTQKNSKREKEFATNWDLDAFIAQNFTIFKENLPLKRAEKIIEFLGKNGLNPQIAIAPEIEGEERQAGEDPTYDILIPLSEQTALENLLAAEVEKQKEYKKKMSYDITPSARGCCKKRHGFVLGTEFLYWKITEDNLDYGSRVPGGEGAVFNSVNLGTPLQENYIEQSFEWDPGVRVTAGYNLPYYGWDTALQWTYIQSKPEMSVSEPNNGIFSNLDPFFDTITEFNEVKANWHLVFNSLDLTVGRNLLLSRKLSIRPNAGLKTTWIHQKFTRTYSGIVDFDSDRVYGPIHSKNDFWGIGPEIGLGSRYMFPAHFGFFFNAAAALLYGKFDIVTTAPYINDGVFFDVIVRDSKHRLSPWLQMQIGLDWSWCFGKNRNITFGVGYECQIFWSQMRVMINLFGTDPEGNLMMNGLILQGKFEF